MTDVIVGSDGYPIEDQQPPLEQTREALFKDFLSKAYSKPAADIETFLVLVMDNKGQMSADSSGDLARVLGLTELSKKILIDNGFNAAKA